MSTDMHFLAILDDMQDLYECKNADYGNSFDRSLNRHGLIAAIVRMEDKLNRLESLIQKPQAQVSESLEDTCIDLANYAAMTARWLRGKKGSL